MNDGRYRPRVLLVEVDATDNPAKCTDCVLKHQIAAWFSFHAPMTASVT